VVELNKDDKRAERRRRRAERDSASRKDGSAKRVKLKSRTREWVDAIVFAVVFMVIVRTLFFDLFRIPTPSMENSLMVGDYLFVSKVHYGTRTPMTLGIPFTTVYLPGFEIPFTRFPGFTKVKREDAVVFNWPADNVSAIDRRQHYIKRIMGLPGETIEVRDKVVFINGERQEFLPTMQLTWNIYKTETRMQFSASAFAELGVTQISQDPNPLIVRIVATVPAIEKIKEWPWVQKVELAVVHADNLYNKLMYPPGHHFSPDNYGPVSIPRKGQTISLTDENWPFYALVLTRYEGHTAERVGRNQFVVDGRETTNYTFSQDYFYGMGDNRDNSEDSRFWGFIPMDHVVGKAVMVYFSWDADSHLPRFSRLFSWVR
jgi:signal peptidase I